jgi:hypothetical protein
MSVIHDLTHATIRFQRWEDNSMLPVFSQPILADPYSREDQAYFAKWYVIIYRV